MKRMMACGALALTLTGCFRMSVRSGAPRSEDGGEETGVSLAYGLTTSNVAAECPQGLSRVDVYWPAWGPLVFFVTFGLVAPMRAEYVCADGGAARPGAPETESGDVPPSHPPL
jgi:hypothetical protein